MPCLEKLLNRIYSLVLQKSLKRIEHRMPENVLWRITQMLEPEVMAEIQHFVYSQITPEGGFADKGGRCDVYYSVFGGYLLDVFPNADYHYKFQSYIRSCATNPALSGIELYCTTLLYARFIGEDGTLKQLHKNILSNLHNPNDKQPEYTNFLSLLCLFYLRDYRSLHRVLKKLKATALLESTSSLAAIKYLLEAVQRGYNPEKTQKFIQAYYRPSGGFAALQNAPFEDLLSTAVGLYVLYFSGAALNEISAQSLTFIESMYAQGGFCATIVDEDADIEYTFYGMLALGSLSHLSKQ